MFIISYNPWNILGRVLSQSPFTEEETDGEEQDLAQGHGGTWKWAEPGLCFSSESLVAHSAILDSSELLINSIVWLHD